jgi:hypothetical protein
MANEENVFNEYQWDDLEILNEELCEKAGYQHGKTSDGYAVARAFFDDIKNQEFHALYQAVNSLRKLHKLAPFLFLNGNTFCEIARELVITYGSQEVKFSAEVYSIVGHHVAGKSIISLDELQRLLGE